jgi:hypothetical protein
MSLSFSCGEHVPTIAPFANHCALPPLLRSPPLRVCSSSRRWTRSVSSALNNFHSWCANALSCCRSQHATLFELRRPRVTIAPLAIHCALPTTAEVATTACLFEQPSSLDAFCLISIQQYSTPVPLHRRAVVRSLSLCFSCGEHVPTIAPFANHCALPTTAEIATTACLFEQPSSSDAFCLISTQQCLFLVRHCTAVLSSAACHLVSAAACTCPRSLRLRFTALSLHC